MCEKRTDGGFFGFLTGVAAGASIALYLSTPEGEKTLKHLKLKVRRLIEEVEKKIEEEKDYLSGDFSQAGDPPPHIAQIQSRGRNHLSRFFKPN
jgi:gas vesicle protein